MTTKHTNDLVEEIADMKKQKTVDMKGVCLHLGEGTDSPKPQQFCSNALLKQPIFLINISYDPDHNYRPDWREYTVGEYLREFHLGVDEFNDMIKAGAVKLKAV